MILENLLSVPDLHFDSTWFRVPKAVQKIVLTVDKDVRFLAQKDFLSILVVRMKH